MMLELFSVYFVEQMVSNFTIEKKNLQLLHKLRNLMTDPLFFDAIGDMTTERAKKYFQH